jgi:hypothetical protein
VSIDRIAETIYHAAEELEADWHRELASAGENSTAKLNTFDLGEGHQNEATVLESDYFGGDA